jgi:hypothetical protein
LVARAAIVPRTQVEKEPDHDDGREQRADKLGPKLLDQEERGNDGY